MWIQVKDKFGTDVWSDLVSQTGATSQVFIVPEWVKGWSARVTTIGNSGTGTTDQLENTVVASNNRLQFTEIEVFGEPLNLCVYPNFTDNLNTNQTFIQGLDNVKYVF